MVISISVADIGCELSAFGSPDDPVELDDGGGGGVSCCFFFENMPPRPLTIMAEGVVGMSSLRDEVFDDLEVFERVLRDVHLLAGLLSWGNTHTHADGFEHRQSLELAELFCSSLRP